MKTSSLLIMLIVALVAFTLGKTNFSLSYFFFFSFSG